MSHEFELEENEVKNDSELHSTWQGGLDRKKAAEKAGPAFIF